jgi:hypothetical protein
MKKFIFTSLFLWALAVTAIAQKTFSAEDFTKNLGKTGTICDTVYSLHIVSDTLTVLNMGAPYPGQKFMVAVKGNKITLDWASLKGKRLCITGVFELKNKKPEIEIAQPEQVNVNDSAGYNTGE